MSKLHPKFFFLKQSVSYTQLGAAAVSLFLAQFSLSMFQVVQKSAISSCQRLLESLACGVGRGRDWQEGQGLLGTERPVSSQEGWSGWMTGRPEGGKWRQTPAVLPSPH